MHNNIMVAGSRDRPPMLAPGRYPQWCSRFLRYVDTRPNDEALRKCILSVPYKPTTVLVHAIEATDNSPAVAEHTTVETPANMSTENKAHFLAEKEAIHLILTDEDDIYSTVDACQTAQEMWEVIEWLQQGESLNIQDVKTNLFWKFGKFTSNDGETMESYYTRFYKLMNEMIRNNLIVTTMQFGNQRTVNVVAAREKVGSQVVQKTGIQCFNCKEYGHFAKECRKPKRVKDSTYHKEKMLLCKQAEQVSNTCLVEKDDSNITHDSPDMCKDDIQNDQNDVEINDERVMLANLIANLKLDVDENKKIQKQLKKANTTLAQELKECKDVLAETSKSPGESISVRDSCLVALQIKQTEFEKYKAFNDRTVDYDKLKRKLTEALGQIAHKDTVIREGLKTKAYELSVVNEKNDELMKPNLLTKSHYEGLVKQKTKVITDLKLKEEHDIEKMLSMEKQIKFLNEVVYKRSQSIQTIHMMAPKVSTYNGRPTFANPRYLKQAQSEIHVYSKPSVLGKPTPFSDSLERRYFPKTRSASKTNVSEGLSKPVTAQTLPQTAKKAVSNTNVLRPGMYRIDNRTTHTRAPQLTQTIRNTNLRVSTSTGVNHKPNVSRPQLKSNQSRNKVLPNNSQVKAKETQVEVHPRIPSVSNKIKSVTACIDSLNFRFLNANVVCATCNKCLIDSNHFACVTKLLNDVHARTKKPNVVPISTRKPQSQVNKSIATHHKKKVASKSTSQKPQSYFRVLYENTNNVWKWWIERQSPSGCKWVPKAKKQWVPKAKMQWFVQLILFIVDSGCTKHMTSNLKLLCNFIKKFMGTVRFGNDQFMLILGYGDLVQGNVAFRKSTCFVRDLQGNDLLTSNRGSDLYTISLQESTSSTPLCLMAKATPTQAWLWHRRLFHLNFDYINLLSKKDIVIGLPKLNSKGRLNLLHMDLCGPMRVASINRKKYIMVIVDDYSRYTWTLFLRSKDETPEVLKDFLTMIQRKLQASVITVRTDRGTKFLNKTLNAFFKKEGIEHQTSTARTPEQNGVVKRRNHADVPSQQELDLLFGPLYDVFFNAGSTLQDEQPSTNIQSTSAPSTHTNVHAEENNYDQAEEGKQLQDDEFTNPFCASAQEAAESSSHNIGNANVPTFNQPHVSEY
nr:hypothetical protein [Tanacetum cinerariifolium]